jgi:hypothetical protein
VSTLEKTTQFQELPGIYEPSAIQQLADGRFLVLEDEVDHPFSLLSFKADGSVRSDPLGPGLLAFFDSFWKLDDLEGIALDHAGYLYAITSHSRDGDGDEKKARDKLVRFRIDGERVTETSLAKGLKAALLATHPVLAAAAKLLDVKNDGGLNIEGLEISPDQQRLLIGLRSPLLDRRAIIASLDNPSAVFASGAAPRISPALQTLNLDGHGIRSLCFFAALGAYLIISGPVARDTAHFQLWFWNGQPASAARRVTVPGLPGFAHAEGICPAVINGQPKIIIVSDDGNRKARRCARFVMLDPAQLQIADV